MATSPLKEVTGRRSRRARILPEGRRIARLVRRNAETTSPGGHLQMVGYDGGGRSELRVRGSPACASPTLGHATLTSGNTNAPTIMIGEKCARNGAGRRGGAQAAA